MNAKKAVTTLSPHSETDGPTIVDPKGHPKHIFVTEDVIQDRLLCCHCTLVLKDPFQAEVCGHSFCGACIDFLLW